MKWFIASDIHGSAFYCKKMLDAYKNEKCDKMLLLGDVLYHGPRNDLPRDYNPKQVIELLNSIAGEIICVRGNCDCEVDQMVLNFNIMAEYAMICENDVTIFATHGHKFNTDNPPALNKGDVLLHGHTHISACEKNGNNFYINPGSISIPKENSCNGYIIFENKQFIFKNLNGEIISNFKL